MRNFLFSMLLCVALTSFFACSKEDVGENSDIGETTYSVLHEQGMPNMTFECREYNRNGYVVVTHEIPVGERFLYAEDESVKIEVYAKMTTKTGRRLETYCCGKTLKKGKHVSCRINNYKSLLQWWDAHYEY